MTPVGRSLRTAALLAAGLAVSAAPALGQKSTTSGLGYAWWTVCGGNQFATCAAVDIEQISTGTMRLRVFNLSGDTNSDWAATIFTSVGFENVGAVVANRSSLTMTGPARPGDSPTQWKLSNDTQVGGGVKLDLVTLTNGVDNGIASACAPAGTLPGGSVDLFMNPCAAPDWDTNAGWVVFEFKYTGTWDFASTDLLLKGQNGPNGMSTECITGTNCNREVLPEPATVILLGTGLLVGAVALRRRRGEPLWAIPEDEPGGA